MQKRNSSVIKETKFSTEESFIVDGFEVNAGETIKIKGEYGSKFKVRGLTTNNETGASWVDCFEVIRGVPSAFRAFKIEKIKRVPQKGKRARRANNI
jgi:hypothetical protein